MTRWIFFVMLVTVMTGLQAQAENWMDRLPDDVFLSVLSVPGAHDAATGSGWQEGMEDLGDAYARTQELTMSQLWSLGVRAFDLRPCVYETHLNLNHGIVPTNQRLEGVLQMLKDSLTASPSEFAIIHLLHEKDGDQVENAYNQRLTQLLKSDSLKDLFVNYKRNLKVADVRGKILLLSRDKYASSPIGGFFENWTGSLDWERQTQARIVGRAADATTLYVQDFSDTHGEGDLVRKVDALRQMLDFSTTYVTKLSSSVKWVFNFASAYSQVESLFGYEISTSNGYRDNAVHTHEAILDYLTTHPAGPTGVVLMDFAGVDQSGSYHVRGKELVRAIIDNNFGYLTEREAGIETVPADAEPTAVFSLGGVRLPKARSGSIVLERHADGRVKKSFHTSSSF